MLLYVVCDVLGLQVFCCPLEGTEILSFVGKANKSLVLFSGSRCVKGDFRWKPHHQAWIRDCESVCMQCMQCMQCFSVADHVFLSSFVAWMGRGGQVGWRTASDC
mgnify:CR=1 FL=1